MVDGWDDLPEPTDPAEASTDPMFDLMALDGAEQVGLFGDSDQFHTAWQNWGGMPEFIQEDLEPWATIVVKFRSRADRAAFADLIGQPLRDTMARGIWYPKLEIGHYWDKRYRAEGEE